MAFMRVWTADLRSSICISSLKLSLMSTEFSPSASVNLRELRAVEPTFELLKYLSLRCGFAGLWISSYPREVTQPEMPRASVSYPERGVTPSRP